MFAFGQQHKLDDLAHGNIIQGCFRMRAVCTVVSTCVFYAVYVFLCWASATSNDIGKLQPAVWFGIQSTVPKVVTEQSASVAPSARLVPHFPLRLPMKQLISKAATAAKKDGSIEGPWVPKPLPPLPIWIQPAKNSSIVPRNVFVAWFGAGMVGPRYEAYKSILARLGVNVTVVNEMNLSQFSLRENPMHPAVFGNYLARNHVVDYVRAYLLHHYGGGFHDIKPASKSWKPHFDAFNDPGVWMVGSKPRGRFEVECDDTYARAVNETGRCWEVMAAWPNLLSPGAYIMRPRTHLTEKWLTLVHNRLQSKIDDVIAHPALRRRCCRQSESPGYPFSWNELHSALLYPLQYQYFAHIRQGLPRYLPSPFLGEIE
eukprot:comp23549_c2_seq1/m.39750 comp23549_c2_seq1/g.39750  ORF comp23549_c2_seq1/g.39750 comp23549_c2_seq1/m.39750 type:complete len:372 (-) comp23549_c2_seq1:865-1980(-)